MTLEQFLVKAKVSTYANQGEGGETILPDGCREMTYQEGAFRYRDRYFGWNPFVGEEVVWEEGQVVWAMNYHGRVLEGRAPDDLVPVHQVYAFLQRALDRVDESRPFRGPRSFREDGFEYCDESEGGIDQFSGLEMIFYQGREIYQLHYHGGRVQDQAI